MAFSSLAAATSLDAVDFICDLLPRILYSFHQTLSSPLSTPILPYSVAAAQSVFSHWLSIPHCFSPIQPITARRAHDHIVTFSGDPAVHLVLSVASLISASLTLPRPVSSSNAWYMTLLGIVL